MAYFQTDDGLNLHYTDTGSGLPILCLAGLTRDGRDFDFVAPHLAGYRLICLDSRGRGASDYAPDHSTYTVPAEAQDALALLDHLNLPSAAILGTSRGGLLAMFLAATARDRLLGACLVDVGPVLETKALENIAGLIGLPPTLPSYDAMEAVWPMVKPGFANVPPGRYRAEIERLFDVVPGGLALRYDAKLRDAVAEVMAAPKVDLWPMFMALDGLPTAVIHAKNSDLLTAQTVADMKRRMPALITTTVPDRAHIPYLDEPAALDAIHTWLKEIA